LGSGNGEFPGQSQWGLVGCALALAHLAANAGRLEEVVLLDTAVATWLTTLPSLPHPHIQCSPGSTRPCQANPRPGRG
jgi:hypothetical protein